MRARNWSFWLILFTLFYQMTRVSVRCIVKCPLSRALLDGTKRYIVTWTSWTTKRKKFNYHAVCARRTWKIHILYVHNRLSFDWCRRENCVNIATTSVHNVPEHRLIIQNRRIISFFVSVFTDIQAHSCMTAVVDRTLWISHFPCKILGSDWKTRIRSRKQENKCTEEMLAQSRDVRQK